MAPPTLIASVHSLQKPAKPKKGKTDLPPTLAVEEENVGPHPYVEAGTQIHLCLQFAKPMVYLPEHRPRPEFKPTDIIPRRIKPVRKPMDCVKAYSAEVLLRCRDGGLGGGCRTFGARVFTCVLWCCRGRPSPPAWPAVKARPLCCFCVAFASPPPPPVPNDCLIQRTLPFGP